MGIIVDMLLRWLSLRALLLSLPALLVAGDIAAMLLLKHAPSLTMRDMTLPLPVATNWYAYGIELWLCALGGLATASILYVALLQRHLTENYLRFFMLTAAVCLGVFLFFPILFSSDLYAYAAYGHMAALGLNPYARVHLDTHDLLFMAAVQQWNNPMPVCVYGPVFVLIAKTAINLGAASGLWTQLMALRLVACGALLACGPLAYAAFSTMGRRAQNMAAAGIVLNPVALWSAAEGHNDAIMLAMALAGFIIARRYSLALGALLVGLSTVIKATGLAAAAVLAVFHFGSAHRLLRVVAGVLGALMLFGMLMLPYASALPDLLNIISRGVHYTPEFSLQYVFALLCTQLLGDHARGYQLGVTLALLIAVSVALYGVNRLRRGDTSGAAYIAFGLWLATPNAYPWYALWILPTAFLALHSRMFWVIIAASLTIFARYLLDIAMPDNTDLGVIVTLIAIGIPCLMLLRGAPKFAAAPLEHEAA